MGGGVFVGRVVSNRMQRTVVVAVNYVVWVPKYGVYEKRVSRHMAHDAEQKCVVGDVVKITSAGRKLSKHKSYNVAQVLLATPSYNPEQAAKDVQERLANRPTSMVAAAKARLEASQARLQALRDMYAKELSKVSRVSRGSSSSSSSSSSSDNTGKGGDGSNDHTVEDETQGSSRSGESSADQGSQGDASSSHSDSSSNGSSMQDASTSSTPRSPSGSPFESTVPGAGPPGVRTACTLAHGAHQHPSCLTPPPASSAATYLLHTPFMPRGLAFQWKPVTTFVSGFVGRWSAPLWEGCSS